MRALLQRVKSGKVEINGKINGQIKEGFVVLLGICEGDGEKECDAVSDKAVNLRVFSDENGKMNKSLLDISGEMLIVSQFTLYADCKKGRRPSFVKAARPEIAIPLYERFIERIKNAGIHTETGVFGADMQVFIENDGPVTIMLDTAEIM